MNIIKKIKQQTGFGVIELIIAVFIVVLAFGALIQLYGFYLQSSRQSANYIKAVSLAQESLEAARCVRDESWDNIAGLISGNDYYPTQISSPPKWSLASGQESIDGFQRRIYIEEVERDANDNIVQSGGLLDPDTKKITTEISWSEKEKNYNINFSTYLTNWQ